MPMPRILVTNDDGIDSGGIRALEQALAELGEVHTVAPAREMSAVSHAISLIRPVSFAPAGPRRWAVDGTPADSVILALHHLLDFPPDLVVSGINQGDNLGPNVYYSGTVSAAMEAALNDIPGIAVSLCASPPFDFGPAAAFTVQLAARVLEEGLPDGVVLNVNVPAECRNGARLTRMGRRISENLLVEGVDPRRRKHYWIHERIDIERMTPDSDYAAIHQGSISVTPLMLDRTDGRSAELLERWLKSFPPPSPGRE